MADKKLISFVVPVLNERDNVAALYDRLLGAVESLSDRFDFEFVLTDNHSEDGTFDEIARLAEKDARIRAFRFSRNFGFQRSILEGYRKARGDAAIQIDADLQDPPELIPRFIELWEQGAHVVYGVRRERKESRLLTASRRSFYRLINVLSDDELPHDAGDFRLVDRRVLDVLADLKDASPYLRGTIAAMGFEQQGVEYSRSERHAGRSKFSLRDLVRLSLDGILNHSVVPLRFATYTGLTVSAVAALSALGYLVSRYVFGQQWPPGFATTTVLILLGIGLNGLFLGIIGEYLGRIYLQVKRGPNAIVERAIDVTAEPDRDEE